MPPLVEQVASTPPPAGTYKPEFTETLEGDDYPLEYYEDGYPKLPACLDRGRSPEPLAEAA